MKKGNINLLNELIQVINNHCEFNVSGIYAKCDENDDGSFSYELNFQIEDSCKNETIADINSIKVETPILTAEKPVSMVDCAIDEPCDVETSPCCEAEERTEKKTCGNCYYFQNDEKLGEHCYFDPKKHVFKSKSVGIGKCWVQKD